MISSVCGERDCRLADTLTQLVERSYCGPKMLVRFSRQSSVLGRGHHPDAAFTFWHAATGTEGQKVRISIVAPLAHIRLPRAAADHVRHVRDRRASICISLLIRWPDGAHIAVTAAFLEGQSEHGHKSSSGSHPCHTFTRRVLLGTFEQRWTNHILVQASKQARLRLFRYGTCVVSTN